MVIKAQGILYITFERICQVKIIKDKKYPKMYRVQWPDKTISVNTPNPDKLDGHYGFYNKTRAKEFLHREGIENYTVGLTYDSPMARREGSGCV